MKAISLAGSLALGAVSLALLVAANAQGSLAEIATLDGLGAFALYDAEQFLELDPGYYVGACKASNWTGKYIPIH